MYDDFKRANHNIKRVLALWQHDRHSTYDSRKNTARPTRQCTLKDLNLDLELYQGSLSERLTKENRKSGRCLSPGPVGVASRLHNLQIIKNLVASLRSKIAAKFKVDKTSKESPYRVTSPVEGNAKTENPGVNLVVKSVVPVISTTDLLPSLPGDCSSILEDVNTLESFLKLVAPVFSNSLLLQKHTKELPRGNEDKTEEEERHTLTLIPDNHTREFPREQEKHSVNFCLENKENSPSVEAIGGILNCRTKCDSDPNESVSTSTTPHNRSLHKEVKINQKTLAHTDEHQKQTSLYNNCSNLECVLTKKGNSVFCSKQTPLKASFSNKAQSHYFPGFFNEFASNPPVQSVTYPTFEQQYESNIEQNENICMGPFLSLNKSTRTKPSLNKTTDDSSTTEINVLSNLHAYDTVSTYQTLDESPRREINISHIKPFLHVSTDLGKVSKNHRLNTGGPTTQKTSEIRARPSNIPFLYTETCRSSFSSQNAGQHIIPLDFNLNALHIKSSLIEEQGAGGDTQHGATGAHDALTLYDPQIHRLNGSATDQQFVPRESQHACEEAETGDNAGFTDKNNDTTPVVKSDKHGYNVIPALDIGALRRGVEQNIIVSISCFFVLTLGILCSLYSMSAMHPLVAVGACLFLALPIYDGNNTGCLGLKLQQYWTKLLTSLTSRQQNETNATAYSQCAKAKKGHAITCAKSSGSMANQHLSPDNSTFMTMPERSKSIKALPVAYQPGLCDTTFVSDDSHRLASGKQNVKLEWRNLEEALTVKRDTTYWSDECSLSDARMKEQQKLRQSHEYGLQPSSMKFCHSFSHTCTDTVSTMTEDMLDSMKSQNPLQEPSRSMAATMTETPTMTSSAAQTDRGEEDCEDDAGEVHLLELSSLFPSPITATVGVQADMGARRLSQRTERVRREHQVSLKRLQRKFLSIRRKCQMEAMSLKQCNRRKNEFLCQLQLSLPGLQQEKRSLLAERAAIERQFEDEKKKNRELVGRLTRLNHQFCKLGQVQQQLPLPSQNWRQLQQQQQQQLQSTCSTVNSSNSSTTITTSTSNSTSILTSQEDGGLLHRPSQQILPTGRSAISGQTMTILSHAKVGKLSSAGPSLPSSTAKIQQQSTLLQTGQVRPNNAAPTTSAYSVYQDHKIQQQQQQQQTRQQQQQHQILLKQQQVLQQQRLPIFQLFNRPAPQTGPENSTSQLQQQQQQQQQQ